MTAPVLPVPVTAAEAVLNHPAVRRFMGPASGRITVPAGVIALRSGPVFGFFHPAPWPGVWFGHMAALPEGQGRALPALRAILARFITDRAPSRLIGWVAESNARALRAAGALGFNRDGHLPLSDGGVVMVGRK